MKKIRIAGPPGTGKTTKLVEIYYKHLVEDTIVYEYKTGPYEGQQLDKEFI